MRRCVSECEKDRGFRRLHDPSPQAYKKTYWLALFTAVVNPHKNTSFHQQVKQGDSFPSQLTSVSIQYKYKGHRVPYQTFLLESVAMQLYKNKSLPETFFQRGYLKGACPSGLPACQTSSSFIIVSADKSARFSAS